MPCFRFFLNILLVDHFLYKVHPSSYYVPLNVSVIIMFVHLSNVTLNVSEGIFITQVNVRNPRIE